MIGGALHEPPDEIEGGAPQAADAAESLDLPRLLFEATRTFGQLRTTRELLVEMDRVCRRIAAYWRVGSVAVYETAPESAMTLLCPLAARGAADGGPSRPVERLPIPTSWRVAWHQDKAVACTSDDAIGDDHAFLACANLASALAVPITVLDTTWGVLLIGDVEPGRRWQPGDVSMLQILGAIFGGALARQRLVHEVRTRDASLRASEARYLALANQRLSLVYRFTADLVLTYANDAYCRFYGQTRDSLLGVQLAALLPAAEVEVLREAAQRLTPGAPVHECDRQICAPDGACLWYRWSDRAIFDDAGHVLEYQSVGYDITEPRNVEDQMREREERYRAIVSSVAVGICLVDIYGQFLECNPAFVRMSGYLPEELVGLTLSQVTCAEDWRDEQRHMARLWEGLASEYCLEKRLVTREGHETWAQAATTVIRDAAGQPQYAVQVLEDITARKEAERVRAAYQTQLRALTLRTTINEERERRRIAQNLHDQIGQSLAIARMQLGKLGGQLPDDDRRRQEIEEIRTLLSDALDYSRTVTCELSPPILHELGLVPALRWLARHFGERYHLPTELEVSEPFPRLSTQLRVVLYHVIRELLVNIVKHADATHAIIHLMRHDGAAIISVEDDGRGVHSSGRQDEPSGGYGLFSVRERVEQLGGAFVMESSRQRGTRCVLRVPLAGTSGEEEEGWA